MAKYLLTLALALSSWGYACDLCYSETDPHKVYISCPCELHIVDDVTIVTTPYSIIIVQNISADDQGLFYLTNHVVNIIKRRNAEKDKVEICQTCGTMINQEVKND